MAAYCAAGLARVAVVVVLAATTSCSVVVEDRAASDEPACAPSTSVALKPVDDGDVNTTFVRATVTGPEGAVADGGVTFYLSERGAPGRNFLIAPATDAQGASLLDVGGYIAVDESIRKAVEDADTLVAEYDGRSATPDRDRLCPSSRSVAFSPTTRAYEPLEIGVVTAAELVERLGAVAQVLETDSPLRMPDGQSACRTLTALLDDLERDASRSTR